uniref:Large ribosomal subunit protein P2 n=2 Tax=Ascaris TaxID=6251 RepID=A0A0M3I7Q6_ASCLU
MRYVAAYMLAAMSGKHHVTTADIENILGSVGVDCDHDKASKVVDSMHGKSVDELIAQGSQYLCSVGGTGGGIAAPVAAGAPAGGAPAAGAAEPEKKEEKKEEKEEESDEDMGFGLFD